MRFKDIEVGMVLAEVAGSWSPGMKPHRMLVVSKDYVFPDGWGVRAEVPKVFTVRMEGTNEVVRVHSTGVRPRREAERKDSVLVVDLDNGNRLRDRPVRQLEGLHSEVAPKREEIRKATQEREERLTAVRDDLTRRKVQTRERMNALGLPAWSLMSEHRIPIPIDTLEALLDIAEGRGK